MPPGRRAATLANCIGHGTSPRKIASRGSLRWAIQPLKAERKFVPSPAVDQAKTLSSVRRFFRNVAARQHRETFGAKKFSTSSLTPA
jgi:hypothetical protein